MATEPGADLATLLDGLGGAPARPGVVHVVGGVRRAGADAAADPSPLTLRAAVLLASADHVLLAPEADPQLRRLVRPGATVERRRPDEVVAAVPPGAVVVVLADDPTAAGGAALARALRATGREVELVPGVPTSGRRSPAPASTRTPPCTPRPEAGPVVVEVADAGALARSLLAGGWPADTPAVVVHRPATTRQHAERTTLRSLAGTAPATDRVVVAVGTGAPVPWRDDLPLAGVTVLVPRSRRQASALSMRHPLARRRAPRGPDDHDRARRRRRAAARPRTSSPRAASSRCASPRPTGSTRSRTRSRPAGLDARALAHVATVACVGPGTARRLDERLHVTADLVPDTSTSAALAEAFPPGAGRVLLPRADIATQMLRDGLRDRGYEPVEVTAYVTGAPAGLPDEVLVRLAAGEVDLLAFASSSTARNFATLVGDHPWSGDVVSIGPVTSATCRELGIPVGAEADPHDLDGLVAALCAAARRRRD